MSKSELDGLATEAKTLLKVTVVSVWELGKVVAKAKELGSSVRKFALKVGCSHTWLNTALALYRRYPTLALSKEALGLPIIHVAKGDFPAKDSKPETDSTTGNSVSTRLLPFDLGAVYKLCSALHKDIRNHQILKAQAKALLLVSMNPNVFWHQIRSIMATEDKTVPLAIVAVQSLYQTYLEEKSRLPKNAVPTGDMIRMAMASAKFLAQLPNDRSEDELLHIFANAKLNDTPTKELWDSLTNLDDPIYLDMHTSEGKMAGKDYKDFVNELPTEGMTPNYEAMHSLYVKLLANADFELLTGMMKKLGWNPKG